MFKLGLRSSKSRIIVGTLKLDREDSKPRTPSLGPKVIVRLHRKPYSRTKNLMQKLLVLGLPMTEIPLDFGGT